MASDTDAVASDTAAVASDTAAVASDTDAVTSAPDAAPHVHHVPGGYVVDLPPHGDTDRVALGCVFARDLDDAIARLDTMRGALVAARATTSPKESNAP